MMACFVQAITGICWATDWNAELKNADRIRSSDSEAFSTILSEISANQNELSPSESDYLEYLEAYKLIFDGDFVAALDVYEKLSKDAVNPDIKFRSLISLINAFAIQRKWNEGLISLDNVLTLLPSIHDPEISGLGLMVASIFYNQLGQYSLGLEYSKRLQNAHSDPRNQCAAEQLKFEALLQLGLAPDESASIFSNGVQVCKSAKEAVIQSNIIRLYAQFLLETDNQPLAAKALLDENEALVLSAKYAPIIAIYQSLQARANWELGQQEKAYQQALAVSQSPAAANALEALIRANKVLFDYHSSRGNSEAALEAYIKYAEADKAYLDEVKTKTLAFQLAQHQSLEQQNKISLLDEQNKLLKVQQQLDQAQAFNNRLLIAVLFCIALGLGTWAWHSWQSQKRLRQLAEFDNLTGLFSRGHFTQVSLSAVEYAKTLNAPISCILLDVDKFKQINDSLGHATGDWALKEVARICKEQVREYEIFGRIGGEEFCLLLPECDLKHATELANAMCQALRGVDTSASGHAFVLTASFGVTDNTRAGYSLDKLMAQADKAMYSAKTQGRNQVQCYSASKPVAATPLETT
ncbi:GGDEF domain-containing protein [Shewanella zhangzhouensis]|nr:GGDEF domain-containing protein [Shewanella zhangzhouensis]